ncbi:MAG: type I-U CRISPR-associated protein Cas5/Cas6 [Planctomycetales bacterium]|nr:type I-U CRISPR-associated protein Cas5/Cas6 [Planctomycetales bacterium]
MSNCLRFTIRFLQPLVHGRSNGDEPEWPPSPLRFFQALVAAAAARSNERTRIESAAPALRWLQELPSPEIVACRGVASKVPTQFYVPDNTADLIVPSWKRGETTKSAKRTEKVVLPTHLDGEAVHYVFRFLDADQDNLDTLKTAARSITHLGWGIDMVAADADVITDNEVQQLSGEHWQIAHSGGVPLRVPTLGTLDDLMRKHDDFLNRLTDEGFKPVPPLREFAVRNYRPSTQPEPRPYCVFTILKPDASGNRAFNTARRTRDVAAWIRHAVAEICEPADWPDFLQFVHGHDADGKPNRSENSSHRFQYLPLPTVNSKLHRVESLRRVMVVAPPGRQDRINFIRRRLLGHMLKWGNDEIGLLNVQPGKDWVREQYTCESAHWTSVTPVILDGYDDRNAAKTEKLLRKALSNAGINAEVAEFDWQPLGFMSGVEPVRAFVRPEKLHGTMVHIRIRFTHRLPGPLALGAGRYRGFGLLVNNA